MEATTVITYVLTGFTLLVFCIYLYFKNSYTYWKEKKIPQLEPTIPFGNLLNVYTKKRTLAEVFGDAYLELRQMGVKQGGIYALGRPVYIPTDPEIIKHILVTDGNNFINHGFYINAQSDPLSAHLFNMEGEQWRKTRKKMTQAFSAAKVKRMFVAMVETAEIYKKHLEKCIEKFPDGIDIKKESFKLTIDVSSKNSFGWESGTLKGKNQEILDQMIYFTIGQWSIFKNTMVFLLPRNILKMMNFKLFPRENTEYVRNMFVGIKDYRKKHNIQREDITDILCKMTEDGSNLGSAENPLLTENEFIAQMWIFFGASSESASSTISFALYELAKKPEYQIRLREEINTVLSRYDNKVTFEAVKEMIYLDWVVNETLRLYPIFPILSRVCNADYKVPGTDFVLEKNTFVMVTNFGIQRDPEYYPDPLTFDPERFSPEKKAERPFIAHMPFGEGPRVCPGKLVGLLLSKVGLLTVVRNFEVSLSDKTTSGFEFVPWEMLLRKTGDIWLHLKRIN